MKYHPLLLPLAFAGACAPDPDQPVASQVAEPVAGAEPAIAPAVDADTLTPGGLGELVIGQRIPASSSFAVRGAQIPGTDCRTVSSPEYPGVHAMTIDGEVRRVTVSDDSEVALAEGIGAGATEAEVRAAFPGFVETPHKYLAAPGKYLTQPGDDPRLHFEIGTERTVSLIHVGRLPELTRVEGCA